MEFKNYFKKFGIGWIVVGSILFILSLLFLFISLLNRDSVISTSAGFGLSPFRFMFSGIGFPLLSEDVLMPSLLLLLPFVVGFFGLIRLFWLLAGWFVIYFTIAFLESGSLESWGLIFTIPLLFLAIVVGIVWEITHHYRNKSAPK